MPETWFAIRYAAGASRPDQRDDRMTRLERDMLENGIDFYFPIETRETIHHRTKALITKRLPLIPGYAFVTDPYAAQRCKTVAGIVGVEGRAIEIPAHDIAIIREAEAAVMEELATQRRRRAAAARKTTRRNLARAYPSGTPVTVRTGFLANERGMVQAAAARGRLRIILDRLKNLGAIELPVDEVEIAA